MPTHPPNAAEFPAQSAEQRLRLQRAMLDGTPDLMWMKDRNGRFLVVNEALAKMANTTADAMIGKTDHDFFPEHASTFLADDQVIVAGAEKIRRVQPIADGSGEVRWYETIRRAVFEADGTLLGVAGVARDVTAEHRGEEALAHHHQRLNELIANVPGVVWEEYFDGSRRYVNDYVEQMLGYEHDEYMARFSGVQELIPEEDRAAFLATSQAMVEQNRGWTHRFRLVHKDGHIIWCESHCSMIRGANGEAIGVRGVSMDVTPRVLAEDALRRSEESFRQLADAAPVMIWTTNAAGEAQFQNRRILEFAGRDHLNGNAWLSIVHPDDAQRAFGLVQNAHVTHEFVPFEFRLRRYDGEWREVLVNATARRDADGTFAGYVGTCVDLTDVRKFERHVEQNERLSGLGRLAATIAHEINNVLMSIQPYAEVIRHQPKPEMLERVSQRIAAAVQRGGRFTHQILRYANATEPRMRELDVREWLDANADEWQTLLGPRVGLRIDVDRDLCMLADPDQLQQVFTNLATNAADAMRGNGTFHVSARKESRWVGLEAGDCGFIHFIVEDSGPGISKDILSRIFEPLFTTRPGGTGLGLAIVHDIVRKHGGAISIDSDRAGACFHVVLPAVRCSERVTHDPLDDWPEEIQRVVIVEDEVTVADALQSLLELFGVESQVVYRGADALGAIASFSPDLVILDIGLPDIPGTQVLEQIRETNTKLPVLLATGHNVDPQTAALRNRVAHILKPFDATALIKAVRTVA